MGMGPFIRRMFGPYERQISEAYRVAFFDIDAFVERRTPRKCWRWAAAREL
jgi:hypothetical protein